MIKLLVVDDESATRKGIVRHLDWFKLGVDLVEEARDGLEGLAVANQLQPDVVITDIRMPGMNGIEFATQIRQQIPSCSIIFLSGYSDKEYLKAAIHLGVVAYIEKPINLSELEETVAAAVVRSRQVAGPMSAATSQSGNRAVDSVIRLIHESYIQPDLSVKILAQRVFLTPTYLSTLFRKETGQTISEYVAATRVRQAIRLMEQPQLKLYEIALKTGFRDANYFAKAFKKSRGMTPTEYRKRYLP